MNRWDTEDFQDSKTIFYDTIVVDTPHYVCVCACSVVSNSLQPHGLQPTRLLCPWNFPGKNTGASCHFLPQIFLTQGLNPRLLCLLQWQACSLPAEPLHVIMCCVVLSHSVVSDSLGPHGLQSIRFLCPWGVSRQECWSGLPCPLLGHTSVQTHRVYNIKSEPNVNCGLWVVMMCQCRPVILTNWQFQSRVLTVGELVPVWAEGHIRTLYFPLNFAVNLKLLLK